MGVMCVLLAIASLIMCLIALIWDGIYAVENQDSEIRGHALFHILKVAVVVPAVVLLLFVFAAHLQCNDQQSTWETKPHCSKCDQCGPKKPIKAEAEPMQEKH